MTKPLDITSLPEDIQKICLALSDGLGYILGKKLFALYVYGAATDPAAAPTGDIDFHAFLTEPLITEERTEILEFHDRIAFLFPPLGAELDGYYVLFEDARLKLSPIHQLQSSIQDNSWALHRAHMLAGRCVVLYGPDPVEILPIPTWAELDNSLQNELSYVEEHLDKYPAYCILNLCRLLYSYSTKEVVISKFAAAKWAYWIFPHWQQIIELARKSYAGLSTDVDNQYMFSQVVKFYIFIRERINAYRESSSMTFHKAEENNQKLWDELAPIHLKSYPETAMLREGREVLDDIELNEIGNVKGKTLLHLQCHIGTDTLSWARRGAVVTGVDFSSESILIAQKLKEELKIQANFMLSNVYDLPKMLDERFDIVYTSRGVLCWLRDLDDWARIIYYYLKPGGIFFILESHPFMNVFDEIIPGQLSIMNP